MDTNELVNVINTGDTPLMLRVDSKLIEVPVGKFRTVNFMQAAGWFGHPQARDDGRNNDRRTTYEMLRQFYGYYVGYDTPDDWAEKVPKFRVETLDGEYMPMVLDDPEGALPLPGEIASNGLTLDAQNIATLQAAAERQQAQIDQLLAIIAAKELAGAAGVDPDDAAAGAGGSSNAPTRTGGATGTVVGPTVVTPPVVSTDKLPTPVEGAPAEDGPGSKQK